MKAQHLHDWQMTPLYRGQATYGTRYFDIIWFINNLINSPYSRFLYSNPVAPVARAFIESYFHETRLSYDPDKFAMYATRFFAVEMPRIQQEIVQNSKRRTRLLLPCSRAILRKFIESLKTIEPNRQSYSSRGKDSGGKVTATMDYRESHLQPGKGQSYHAAFSDFPYRNMVWKFEKGILDRILATFYGNSEIHHFDFACGTGRILSYLEDRTKSSVGVDLSPSMLEVASRNKRSAEVIEADLTRNDVLGDRRFNLITAFRFFPNAQTELRMEAMQMLSRHLDDNGYLVFNNHKNKGMSIAEVKALLEETGLEIVKIYHLCVFPASDERMLLPLFLLPYIERILNRIPVLHNLGENLVFVCKCAEVCVTPSTNRDQR